MPIHDDEISIRVSADVTPFQASLGRLGREAEGFSRTITSAFKQAAIGGRDFESVLQSLGLRLASMAFDRAFQPVGNLLGGLVANVFKAFGLANGGVLGGGRIKAFANGGVLGGPTLFPLARGLGLAGEAGPEAVLPLARGSDGRLGVRSEATAPVVVTFNVTAADADSFRKSEAQVTAMLARAVGRGRRGL